MEGHAFEHWCASLLMQNGFSSVEVTPGSNDQGVDILARKDGIKYAIQCKCYSSDLGNTPVQEVNTGKAIYRCQVGVVMTNRHFTKGAQTAADATGILLWDREKLIDMVKAAP
jgi:restriction system protein